ncbi:MAG: NAD(P)/FAD-dependent oxidoreductase [Thermoguttaceae bacterium]
MQSSETGLEPNGRPWDVVVVGAGAAGLVAAFRSAERGRHVLLLEKNRKPGAKILMSGGTRCNLTHATDKRGILQEFGPQGRFLHSALSILGPQDVVEMFEAEGVATKVETTGKIFPASDKALDVLGALLRRLERSGCVLAREEPLERIDRSGARFLLATSRRDLAAEKVILACGGKSHPGCGTSGDGYAWAAALGHAVIPPRPALVPLRTDAAWVSALKGITLPDVVVRVAPSDLARSTGLSKRTVLAEHRGSFLFTHFGLSGPAVLNVSRAVSGHPRPETLAAVCDLLPEIRPEAFDAQLAQQGATAGKRQLATILGDWIPQRLAESILNLLGLPGDRRVAELAKADRLRLVQSVKQLAIPLSGTLGFKKAEVTAGGVALDEIDSRTLQSKLVPNLHVAGELLDLDGPIGGYNFQAAFSTGWLAGESV